jgi:hypothetical protein
MRILFQLPGAALRVGPRVWVRFGLWWGAGYSRSSGGGGGVLYLRILTALFPAFFALRVQWSGHITIHISTEA